MDFLTNDYIKSTCDEIDISSLSNDLIDLKNNVFSNKEHTSLFENYLSTYFYENVDYEKRYENLLSIFNEKTDLFILLICIAKIKDTKQFYSEKNIPNSILYDTLKDIKIWTENNKAKTGNTGLSNINWISRHLTGKLFKIGRLQFEKIEFKGDVKLFKQAVTGFPLILSDKGVKYDLFGSKTLENEAFISEYIESDITITANPILSGKCQNTLTTINKCDYSLEIENGTSLLNIHIDQSEKLNIKDSINSMKEAIKFFYKYFNGAVIKGFTCTSWLLNRNYRHILDESSNIHKFASMFYEYPIIPYYLNMYERVFNGESDISVLEKIDSKTSLQKAIIQGLKEGLTFEDAAIIYPSYDMKKLEKFTLNIK